MSRKQLAVLISFIASICIVFGLRNHRRGLTRTGADRDILPTKLERLNDMQTEEATDISLNTELGQPQVHMGSEIVISIALAGWWSGLLVLVLNCVDCAIPGIIGGWTIGDICIRNYCTGSLKLPELIVPTEVLKLVFSIGSALWITEIALYADYWQRNLSKLANLDASIKPSRIPGLYHGLNYTDAVLIVLQTILFLWALSWSLEIPIYWIVPGPLILLSWIMIEYLFNIGLGSNRALRLLRKNSDSLNIGSDQRPTAS